MTTETTTIRVSKDTHKDLMLFKIHSNARDLDEVIKQIIKKLKAELNPSPSSEGDACIKEEK